MTGKQGQSQGYNVLDWPELRGVTFNTHSEAGKETIVKSGAESPTEASLHLFPMDGHMSPRTQASLRQPFPCHLHEHHQNHCNTTKQTFD